MPGLRNETETETLEKCGQAPHSSFGNASDGVEKEGEDEKRRHGPVGVLVVVHGHQGDDD
jgi:hypothetical protein